MSLLSCEGIHILLKLTGIFEVLSYANSSNLILSQQWVHMKLIVAYLEIELGVNSVGRVRLGWSSAHSINARFIQARNGVLW